MSLPIITIIGRPNVGKSSLLNALAKERISIVEPTAGVTRDRVSTIIEAEDRYFELTDTGGYGIVDSDQLESHVEGQIKKAMESADLILFMTDIRDGVVPLDSQIAGMLRKQNARIIGVANKADNASMFPQAADFNQLGFGEFLCISALNNLNKNVLVERILKETEHLASSKPEKPALKIAVVGKRNAGKSTLINSIVGSDRVIVSNTPGTTRDSVDINFQKDSRTLTIIDTAGVRKKRKLANSIEFYSYVRSTAAIKRADIVLMMIDSTVPISQVDKKLARCIMSEYKSCILVINKWDLARDTAATEDYEEYLTRVLPGLKYAPLAFTTATESRNIQSLLDLTLAIDKQASRKITTGRLNKAFETIQSEKASGGGRRRPKIYYAVQVSVRPVTILMFVNNPELFDENYRSFIINRVKLILDLEEVPVRLLARRHRD